MKKAEYEWRRAEGTLLRGFSEEIDQREQEQIEREQSVYAAFADQILERLRKGPQ